MPLSAEKYSQTLLAMHARVMPSIVLMDRQIAEKTPPGRLEIVILHGAEDADHAAQFAALLEHTYPQGIGGYVLKGRPLPYNRIGEIKEVGALYLLPAPPPDIQAAVALGIERHIVTFGHDEASVREGVLASLSVGKKSAPYLNTDTIAKSRILFNPTLIGIAKRFPE